MRYLGVDYGRSRIGFALSDPEGRIAFPQGVYGDLDTAAAAAGKLDIGAIVVGIPKQPGGGAGEFESEIRSFAELFQAAVQSQKRETGNPLPIHFENEFLTTKIAEHESPAGAADAVAAALILQSFLDRMNHETHASSAG